MERTSLKTIAAMFVAGFLILPLAKQGRTQESPAQAATERKRDPTQVAQMNPEETRILNPRSASNDKRTQENFSALPLLCHNKQLWENESRH
jgi:hypothetical protein